MNYYCCYYYYPPKQQTTFLTHKNKVKHDLHMLEVDVDHLLPSHNYEPTSTDLKKKIAITV